jgi:hypothetical protein
MKARGREKNEGDEENYEKKARKESIAFKVETQCIPI